jgi:hypothetical protein
MLRGRAAGSGIVAARAALYSGNLRGEVAEWPKAPAC